MHDDPWTTGIRESQLHARGLVLTGQRQPARPLPPHSRPKPQPTPARRAILFHEVLSASG